MQEVVLKMNTDLIEYMRLAFSFEFDEMTKQGHKQFQAAMQHLDSALASDFAL
jgi:hypothetical protein